MNYKLINKQTGQETVCSKVILDGFDYYVSDKKPKLGNYYIDDAGVLRQSVTDDEEYWDKRTGYKKVIATNNPNIDDLPKVVDVVDELAKFATEETESKRMERVWKAGYNKSQETHPFSEEDVIEFLEWVIFNYPNQWKSVRTLNTKGFYSTKKLLQLWKEQKPKTIWYE